MKCVVVLACGLAEDPREQLNGKTPLEAARTPVLDQMASRGILGLTRTIPRGARLACETGGAALLGYDPLLHPVRAAGLEALGVGVTLGPRDVAYRASLITLDTNEDGTEILGDALGGRLPPSEAAELVDDPARAVGAEGVTLHAGLGHRHLLVWREDDSGVDCRTCGHFYNPNSPAEPECTVRDYPCLPALNDFLQYYLGASSLLRSRSRCRRHSDTIRRCCTQWQCSQPNRSQSRCNCRAQSPPAGSQWKWLHQVGSKGT
jgi:2,3-bisphosphoglycerate-independent phosphoglycerate mutase